MSAARQLMRRMRDIWHDDAAWTADRRTRNVVAVLVGLFVIACMAWTLVSATRASASDYCPHHNYKRHGGSVFFDYMGHKTGDNWHKHYYNRYVWNGARYVFDNGIIRYCYKVDIAAKPEAKPQELKAIDTDLIHWYFTCRTSRMHHTHPIRGVINRWRNIIVLHHDGKKYVRGTWDTFDIGKERIVNHDRKTYGPC